MVQEIVLALLAQDLPVKLAGKHYDLRADTTKEQAQEVLDFMDEIHAAYAGFFGPSEKRKSIVLYQDRAEYLKRSGGGASSAACYNGKVLAAYWDAELTKPCLAHEAVHQFVHLGSKFMYMFPEWFHEGLADALADYEVVDGKIQLATGRGTLGRMRRPLVEEAIRAGKSIPLSDFLKLSEKKFQEGSPLTYAQAWSFCHFLLSRYKKRLLAFYEAVRAGGSSDKAWTKAFDGVALDALEKEWKAFAK